MLCTTAVNTILTLLVGRGLRLRVVALARRMQRSVADVENETIASRRAELLRQLMVELRDRECELNSMAAAHQRHAEAWQRDHSRATRLQDKCSQLHSQYTSWRRGVVVSDVRRMNEVNARRARLVPGWVTVFGRVYHLGM